MARASVKLYPHPGGGYALRVRTVRDIIEDLAAGASPALAADLRALEALLPPAAVNRFERDRDKLMHGCLAKNLGNTKAAGLIAEAKGQDPETVRTALRRDRKRWDKNPT